MSARLRDLFPNAAGSGAVWECAVTGVTPEETGLAVRLHRPDFLCADRVFPKFSENRRDALTMFLMAGIMSIMEIV